MASPFPGMDPYLEAEAFWPDFQHNLVICLHQNLLPGLVDRYKAVIERRGYAGPSREHLEEFIEIRQQNDGKLVTFLDVLSPANKLTAAGRAAYLEQRRQARSSGANLVEIDLVLQGQPTLDYRRENLPDWDYAVTVTRVTLPERHEIYTSTVRKQLPRFRLPLAGNDRDTVLDLQAIFQRCYESGNFGAKIDYGRPPAVPLDEEDHRWLDDMLTSQGYRKPLPAHGEIAQAAYRIWEQEGRPHGRDREHWQKAMDELRRPERLDR